MIGVDSGDGLGSKLTLVQGWPEGAATIHIYRIETQEISRPLAAAVQLERYGRTRTRTRFLRDDDDCSPAIFHGAAEPIPPRRDDAARVLRRDIADVENNQTKTTGM